MVWGMVLEGWWCGWRRFIVVWSGFGTGKFRYYFWNAAFPVIFSLPLGHHNFLRLQPHKFVANKTPPPPTNTNPTYLHFILTHN